MRHVVTHSIRPDAGLCCVVFGAAVRPDGVPSGTMRRRVEGAFSIGGRCARYFVTGGVGRFPPAEAEVMADLLETHGVPRARITLDTNATDTLSSARNVARLIHLEDTCRRVVVCTSRYHIPRCRMLLRCMGIRTVAAPMPTDRHHLGRGTLMYLYMRECVAYPWDLVTVLLQRQRFPHRGTGKQA